MLFDILYVLLGIIIGGIAGFLIARKYMTQFIKKNPPVNEQMIKIMLSQMGRTPSKKQVNQIMQAMNKQL